MWFPAIRKPRPPPTTEPSGLAIFFAEIDFAETAAFAFLLAALAFFEVLIRDFFWVAIA